MINSLKQWVDDNHENQGPKHKLIYEHNQNMLKEGFKWFLFRDDCRQHHRACLQVIKILTNKDPSEYREIQKQINIRRKQAASKFSRLSCSCHHHQSSICSNFRWCCLMKEVFRCVGLVVIYIIYILYLYNVVCVNVINNFQFKSVAFAFNEKSRHINNISTIYNYCL